MLLVHKHDICLPFGVGQQNMVRKNFAVLLNEKQQAACQALMRIRSQAVLIFGPDDILRFTDGNMLKKKALDGKSVVVRFLEDELNVTFDPDLAPNVSSLDAMRVFPKPTESGQCVVCKENEAVTLLAKCAHLCYCDNSPCIDAFALNPKCPVCGEKAVYAVKVF